MLFPPRACRITVEDRVVVGASDLVFPGAYIVFKTHGAYYLSLVFPTPRPLCYYFCGCANRVETQTNQKIFFQLKLAVGENPGWIECC